MKMRTTALRVVGAALMAVAVTPWLSAGTASAAATDDSNCATRPDGVPAYATCAILDENTGNNTALHGETWAWVDKATNDLHVVAFPTEGLASGDSIQLCIRTTAPYPASDKCSGERADRVFVGTNPNVVVDLDALGIAPGATVYYTIHVNQGTRTTVSFGAGGIQPTTPSTPSTPATTPASTPATTPPASVLPTKASTSPSTEVKGEKNQKPPAVLPKTGSGMSLGMALTVSFGLLLGGAALMFFPRGLTVEKGKRRRH